MKKILLATTALAAVSVVSVAQAQESNMMSAAGNEVTIGGFYEFGYVSFDESKAGTDVDSSETYGDSELILDFENTADSGLTYGVHLELEVVGFDEHRDGEPEPNTDEANIYLSGDFGRVNLGHQDGAFGSFVTWANTHSGATSQDDNPYFTNGWGVYELGNGLGASLAPITGSVGGGTGGLYSAYDDDAKIGYFSPNFSGFQFGVSIEDNDSKGNPSAFGASYSTELGDVGVLGGTTFGITYAYASNGADGNAAATETSIGVSVGLGDLAITVSNYSGTGSGNSTTANNTGAISDVKDINRKNLEIGVAYQISDSISVALSRSTGTAKKFNAGDVYNAGHITAGGGDLNANVATLLTGNAAGVAGTATAAPLAAALEDEATYTTLSGGYSIAPGLNASLAINQFEVTRSTATGTKRSAKNDGQEVVFQVNFAF